LNFWQDGKGTGNYGNQTPTIGNKKGKVNRKPVDYVTGRGHPLRNSWNAINTEVISGNWWPQACYCA